MTASAQAPQERWHNAKHLAEESCFLAFATFVPFDQGSAVQDRCAILGRGRSDGFTLSKARELYRAAQERAGGR